ncbi:MAG: DUF4190 domain-containing protein [Anaerolineales bacterium]
MTEYPPNPSYQSSPIKPNSTMALASLILGILGWTVIPGIGSIAAIITGHLAKSEIKNSMGALGGDGMATAGLALGYASIALGLCVICAAFVLPLLGIGLFSLPFLQGG